MNRSSVSSSADAKIPERLMPNHLVQQLRGPPHAQQVPKRKECSIKEWLSRGFLIAFVDEAFLDEAHSDGRHRHACERPRRIGGGESSCCWIFLAQVSRTLAVVLVSARASSPSFCFHPLHLPNLGESLLPSLLLRSLAPSSHLLPAQLLACRSIEYCFHFPIARPCAT